MSASLNRLDELHKEWADALFNLKAGMTEFGIPEEYQTKLLRLHQRVMDAHGERRIAATFMRLHGMSQADLYAYVQDEERTGNLGKVSE